MVMERDVGQVLAEHPERVDVRVAGFAPVAELDAQLEGRAGSRHEVGFAKPSWR
jgi:hypothetical protein